MAIAFTTTTMLVIILTGASWSEVHARDYRPDLMTLMRLAAAESDHRRWERHPRIDPELTRIEGQEDTVYDDAIRSGADKRSAVASALHAGRRRRQPAPALGKAVTPFVGAGVLNDMGTFFDSLRDNLETLASLSPEQRSTLFQEPPSVVHAPSSGGGSGGGIRKLHALRPLRPTGGIRSYNRRSFMETESAYPGAYHHDPELLWTGLGR